jgi:hypothetical protein
MAPKKTPVEVEEVELLDEGEDLDRLYKIFDVTDNDDINGIVDGSIGEDFED